jgi:hypothetical protein
VTRDNNINTSSNICHSLKSKKEKKNSDNVWTDSSARAQSFWLKDTTDGWIARMCSQGILLWIHKECPTLELSGLVVSQLDNYAKVHRFRELPRSTALYP